MYKTSVYTLATGNIEELAHRKQQNHKKWYCPHHTDCVSLCCWIISPYPRTEHYDSILYTAKVM